MKSPASPTSSSACGGILCSCRLVRHGELGVAPRAMLTPAPLALTAQPAAAYEAYVSNEKSNTVSVIDTDKLEVVKTIKVGQRPRGIELTKDGKSVMVAVGDDDTIQMIDTKTKRRSSALCHPAPIPNCSRYDPDGKLLYVANENDNTVTDHRHRKSDAAMATFRSASSPKEWPSARTARS